MTRNEKLSELLCDKLFKNEITYIIGSDFQLEGLIHFVNTTSNTVCIETSIGDLTISYNNITTII